MLLNGLTVSIVPYSGSIHESYSFPDIIGSQWMDWLTNNWIHNNFMIALLDDCIMLYDIITTVRSGFWHFSNDGWFFFFGEKEAFGGGDVVLIILHAIVIWPLTSHPYKAVTEHARFCQTRRGRSFINAGAYSKMIDNLSMVSLWVLTVKRVYLSGKIQGMVSTGWSYFQG